MEVFKAILKVDVYIKKASTNGLGQTAPYFNSQWGSKWIMPLEYWPIMVPRRGPVPHMCVSERYHHCSVNGLSPDRHKAIPESMPAYHQLDPKEQMLMKFYSKLKHFYSRKYIWKLSSANCQPLCFALSVLRPPSEGALRIHLDKYDWNNL